jgi:hypothetical protein
MQNDDNDFAYLHVRPGLFGKEHPVATIAVNTIAEDDYATSPHRFAVGFAAQHVKKDRQWNGDMGRTVSRGRAEKSANRVYVHANPGTGRRDLLILAAARVLEAVESGELFATKKVKRALQDTVDRLVSMKAGAEHRINFNTFSDAFERDVAAE